MNIGLTEKLVRRKASSKELFLKALILVAFCAVVPLIFLIPVISFLSPFIILGLGYLVWFLLGKLNKEFEYSLMNDDFSIDVIYNQRKRKTLMKFNIRGRMEIMAPITISDKTYLNKQVTKVLDVSSVQNSPNAWFMLVHDESGLVKVLFEPNDKLINNIRTLAPSKVKLQ